MTRQSLTVALRPENARTFSPQQKEGLRQEAAAAPGMLSRLAALFRAKGPVGDRYVVSKRSTGLGDRLAALSAAWRYARLTHRTLVVDWRFGGISAGLDNAFASCFEPGDEFAGVRFIGDRHVPARELPKPRHPKIWDSDQLLDIPFIRLREQSIDERRAVALIRTGRDVRARTVVFDGCINDGIVDLTEARQFYAALTPAPTIRSDVAAFQANSLGRGAIGVHIRHGNGGDIMGHRRYWDSTGAALSRCAAAVAHVRQRLGSDRPVFLATDSQEIEARFKALVENVVTRPKDFRAEGAGELHLDVAAWRHVPSAIADMLLLAKCETLIRYPPGSFFSLYAAVLLSADMTGVSTTYDLLRPWNDDPLGPSIVGSASNAA